jgi:hypothetical protein
MGAPPIAVAGFLAIVLIRPAGTILGSVRIARLSLIMSDRSRAEPIQSRPEDIHLRALVEAKNAMTTAGRTSALFVRAGWRRRSGLVDHPGAAPWAQLLRPEKDRTGDETAWAHRLPAAAAILALAPPRPTRRSAVT